MQVEQNQEVEEQQEDQVKEARRRRPAQRILRLTERDIEVIEFLLDMKFASIEEIHFKFFRVSRDGRPSTSMRWAWERLALLRKFGFIKSVHHFDNPCSYFLATRKGYYAVRGRFLDRAVTKPTHQIDIRTFAHDRLVLTARLDLEQRLEVTSWISDRQLKGEAASKFGLSSAFTPDAIYRHPSGHLVAFELEIARKSKARYRDKIQRYVYTIRERTPRSEMFTQVQYVCTKRCVFEFLKSDTRIYGDMFQVEFAKDAGERKLSYSGS